MAEGNLPDGGKAILGRPVGHDGAADARSHPEFGRESPPRRWYFGSKDAARPAKPGDQTMRKFLGNEKSGQPNPPRGGTVR